MRLSKPNAVPKPKPAALEREARRKTIRTRDEAESAKVKQRSGGRCEIWAPEYRVRYYRVRYFEARCPRRAVHVHHLLSGIGVRGRGASALAKNKLHLCDSCHRAIHNHTLVPDGDAWRWVK